MVEKLWKADAIWFGFFDNLLWRELVVSLLLVENNGLYVFWEDQTSPRSAVGRPKLILRPGVAQYLTMLLAISQYYQLYLCVIHNPTMLLLCQ